MPTTTRTALGFIDANPAVDAYNQGVKTAQQIYAADQAAEAQMWTNAYNRAVGPTKLRQITADADRSVADAQVATGTVQPRISQAQSAAALAGTNAYVSGQTAPYRIDEAASGARTARAGADVAEGTVQPRIQQQVEAARTAGAGADVAVTTVPAQIETKQAGARRATAEAVNVEMAGFYKSLDLLNSGQVDAAREIARRTGQELPEEVVQNSTLRAAITQAADHAKIAYPNRPRDQQAFVQGFIGDITEREKKGQAANDPRAVYQVPAAPTPPELATATQIHAPAEVQTAEWLVAKGVAPSAQAAWDMVRQSKSNPAQMRMTVFNNALRSTFGDQAKAQKITDEVMAQMGMVSTTPAPAAAAAAATNARNAPPRPPNVPPGSAFSPSRGLWRDPQGNLYGKDGTPARM